jgi:predicted Rossmann-fold nucleotide-binding protein
VVGVIPRHLFGREIALRNLTELVEVGSMHERKQKMFELADAFVALPGGMGTLEELTEITTWAQRGRPPWTVCCPRCVPTARPASASGWTRRRRNPRAQPLAC